MPRRWRRAAGLALLAAPITASAEPNTAANRRRHPAIVEIRAIYQETNDAEVAGNDRDGGLRFVFVTAGAVNGIKIEYRVYLSKAGARLWGGAQRLEGTGIHVPKPAAGRLARQGPQAGLSRGQPVR